MRRVYVAGLYSRNADGTAANICEAIANMGAGQKACLRVLQAGFAPFCPWFDFHYGILSDSPIEKDAYQNMSLAWLDVSDAVWVISGEGSGGGVDVEIARANQLQIPVYRSFEELVGALR